VLQPSPTRTRQHAASRTPPTRYLSPLRYPGAKSKLTPLIGDLIRDARNRRALHGQVTLVEPFAGGASTTLRLLTDGVVERAIIGDADPMLSSFWYEAASAPERLIERMSNEFDRYLAIGGDVAVSRWDYWRAWQPELGLPLDANRAALALKCLFLNRTTFSGILHGSAGPIGGRAQASEYTIGCRFPVDGLAERIRWIGHLADTGRLVLVHGGTWRETLDIAVEFVDDPGELVAYLDPPYIEKSDRLYATGFEGSGHAPDVWRGIGPHQALAGYLLTTAPFRWILSYDFHRELLENVLLYGRRRTIPTAEARAAGAGAWRIQNNTVALQHSASTQTSRREVKELILTTL